MRKLFVAFLPLMCAACVTTGPQATPGSASEGSPDGIKSVRADISRSLFRKFTEDNPGAREHVLHMNSAGLDEGLGSAALRLERVLVGEKGTLLEITALPRPGRPNSAVMRRDTLRIRTGDGKIQAVTAFQGVEELRDPQGGSALVAKPGDTLYLLAGPINDYYPFSLIHTLGSFSSTRDMAYFENIDPRFRERYDASFAAATTPEKMRDFLTEFGKTDPDRHAPDVFMRLIKAMRGQNTFEGFYHAYLLLKEPQDAKAAMRLVRTDKQRAMMEDMAVATLADKSRLIDFDLSLEKTSTTSGEGSGGLFNRYNFTASRPIRGTLTVKAKMRDTPIKLHHGTYRVTLVAKSRQPMHREQESFWLGNASGAIEDGDEITVKVTLAPPSYSAKVPVDLGRVQVAFVQRGNSGGYTYRYATSDASVSLAYKNMELIQ